MHLLASLIPGAGGDQWIMRSYVWFLPLENFFMLIAWQCEDGWDSSQKDTETVVHKWLYIFILECLKFMQLFQ